MIVWSDIILYYQELLVPYCLAVTPCSLLRPPPIFGRNYCKGLFYLHYTPPPAGRSSWFAVLQFCTCTRVASVEELYLCIKRVENRLRTGLGLFRWSRTVSWGRHPAVAAGGRSLAARLPAMFCNMYVANNSSILQYCHGMSIEGVLVFYRTTEYANSWKGGGLNCEAKAQVLVVTPPPLFFLKVGRKRGGRNSGAVRYNDLGSL